MEKEGCRIGAIVVSKIFFPAVHQGGPAIAQLQRGPERHGGFVVGVNPDVMGAGRINLGDAKGTQGQRLPWKVQFLRRNHEKNDTHDAAGLDYATELSGRRPWGIAPEVFQRVAMLFRLLASGTEHQFPILPGRDRIHIAVAGDEGQIRPKGVAVRGSCACQPGRE